MINNLVLTLSIGGGMFVIGMLLICFRKAASSFSDGKSWRSPANPMTATMLGIVFGALGLLMLWLGLRTMF